jgi:hypothetical protein
MTFAMRFIPLYAQSVVPFSDKLSKLISCFTLVKHERAFACGHDHSLPGTKQNRLRQAKEASVTNRKKE